MAQIMTRRCCVYCERAHDERIACPSFLTQERTRIMMDTTAPMTFTVGGVSPMGWAREHVADAPVDALSDDTTLPLDAWNAKVEALLADVAAYHAVLEEDHPV
jgi:hypothetical protein